MGKFGEALGIWHVTTGGADFDLKPQMGDIRKFRNLLTNEQYQKDKSLMFDKFTDFMYQLIKRDHPEDDSEEIKQYLEINCIHLFNEAMISFRFTTKDEIDTAKKEVLEKSIPNV